MENIKEVESNLNIRPVETKNSWFGAFVLFMTGTMSFAVFGLDLTILGPLVPILQNVYNATYQERYGAPLPDDTWLVLFSLTFSLLLVGGFVGGINTKNLLRIFSRKHLLQLMHVVNILGYLVIALAGGLTGSYKAIIVGRFVTGVALGSWFVLGPLLTVELSTKSKQADWQSALSISFTFGLLVGLILSYQKVFGTADLWPLAVAFPCLPSLLYLLVSPWFPESPYYLVREGQVEEAADVLMKLRKRCDELVMRELSNIEKEVNMSTNTVGVKEILTTKQYRNQLIAVAGIYAGFMLTGANNVTLYTDQLFLKANVSPDNVTTASIGVYSIQLLFSCLGPKLVDRFGSLRVSKFSTAMVIVTLSVFTVCQALNYLAPQVLPIIAIATVCVYFIPIVCGVQLTSLVLAGELTTESSRPTILALASIVFWITSWMVAFVPPYLQASLGAYDLTVWIGTSILFLLFQYFFLPDTRGKTVDEIQAHFM